MSRLRNQNTDMKAKSPRSSATFEQVSSQRILAKKPLVKPSTYAVYSGILHNHLLPELGSLEIAGASSWDLQNFFAVKLLAGRRDGRGALAPKTVADIWVVLGLVLGYAQEHGFCTAVGAAVIPVCPVQRTQVLTKTDQKPANGVITVTNTGDALLSITKLRVAFSEESPYYDEGSAHRFGVQAMSMQDVIDFLSYLEEYVEVTETIEPVKDGNVVEVEPEEPEIPEEPVEPEEPVDPGFGVDPIDPGFGVDPEQSVDPEQPVDPEEQPGETEEQPGETEEPVDPEQPETGVVATKPGNVVELPPEAAEEESDSEEEQTPAQPQKTYGEIWAEQKKQMELQKEEGENA